MTGDVPVVGGGKFFICSFAHLQFWVGFLGYFGMDWIERSGTRGGAEIAAIN